MNLTRRDELIKASPAIQIQSRISLLQRRAWNVLLANAYDELPDKDIHRVSVAELAAKLGFNSGNWEHYQDSQDSGICRIERSRESEFPPTEESGLETPPTRDNHTPPTRDNHILPSTPSYFYC